MQMLEYGPPISLAAAKRVAEEAVAAGGLGLRRLATQDLCPLEGGIPLISNGKLIGAIGVSGAQSTQDGQVATAGARPVNGR